MGLFGVAEILLTVEKPTAQVDQDQALPRCCPSREEWRRSIGAIARGTGIGFFLGLIPGVGAIIPTFMAYIAREAPFEDAGAVRHTAPSRAWRHPRRPTTPTPTPSMIPLLTLGIPSSPTIAVLMGAFIINGLTPGPVPVQGAARSRLDGDRQLLRRQRHAADPQPAAGRPVGAACCACRYQYLCVGTLLFCVIGAYSLQQSVFDIGVMLVFGVIGYVLRKIDLPVAPAGARPDPRAVHREVAAHVARDVGRRLLASSSPVRYASALLVHRGRRAASSRRCGCAPAEVR